MFALSSKITFAKTVVVDAPTRRAGGRAAHVVKVRANASMDKRARGRRCSTRVSTRRRWFGRAGARV